MTVKSRFLTLLGLRWGATGLLMPVALLLPLERGLTVVEVGVCLAAQGVVVLLFEVPSGALTDSWGRRPVFMASALVAALAHLMVLVAHSVAAFVAAWAVTGLFRALDSGPFEAWFVDAEHERGAAGEVPSGLAHAGGVSSAAIAAGSLLSAGLMYVTPWSTATTLALPYAAAIGAIAVQFCCAWWFMERAPQVDDAPRLAWNRVLVEGIGLALGPVLRWFTAAMVMVGVGVASLELFMPVRLVEFTADPARAATVLGVVVSAAWGLASVGAAVSSRLLRVVSPAVLAPACVVVEAIGLAVMALAGGPALLIAGFWLAYLVHTSFAATYNSLVHARVDAGHRGTALSVTSMAFLGSGAAAGVGLGTLAEALDASAALMVGAGVLVVAGLFVARGSGSGAAPVSR